LKGGIDLQHSYQKGARDKTTIRAGRKNEKQATHSSIFDTGVLIPRRSAECEAGFDRHAPRTGVGCNTEGAERGRITNGSKILTTSIIEKY